MSKELGRGEAVSPTERARIQRELLQPLPTSKEQQQLQGHGQPRSGPVTLSKDRETGEVFAVGA